MLRKAATRLITKLETLSSAEKPAREDIQDSIHLLEQEAQQLKESNREIQTEVPDDAFEDEFEIAIPYQDNISLAISRTRRLLIVVPGPNADLSSQEHHTENRAEAGPLHQGIRTVALPKLLVPTFAGKLEEWQWLWYHFRTTINDSPTLPKSEKFMYFLSYLSGRTKRTIEWILITEATYDSAISILPNRFGRQRFLVDCHIDQILALPPVTSSGDVEKLRELYDSIQFRAGCMNNFGVQQPQYGVILYRVLMSCLPEDLAVEFTQ